MVIRQMALPNAKLGDDIRIWEGFIVYEVLYLMFEVETVVSFMAEFLIKVTILIEVPSKRYRIRRRCGL